MNQRIMLILIVMMGAITGFLLVERFGLLDTIAPDNDDVIVTVDGRDVRTDDGNDTLVLTDIAPTEDAGDIDRVIVVDENSDQDADESADEIADQETADESSDETVDEDTDEDAITETEPVRDVDDYLGSVIIGKGVEGNMFQLMGELKAMARDVDRIDVVWFDASGEMADSYTLNQFAQGDNEFRYNIAPDLANVEVGRNMYRVELYADDVRFVSKTLALEVDQESYDEYIASITDTETTPQQDDIDELMRLLDEASGQSR